MTGNTNQDLKAIRSELDTNVAVLRSEMHSALIQFGALVDGEEASAMDVLKAIKMDNEIAGTILALRNIMEK